MHTYVVGSLNIEKGKKNLSGQVLKLELELLVKDTIAIKKKKYVE